MILEPWSLPNLIVQKIVVIVRCNKLATNQKIIVVNLKINYRKKQRDFIPIREAR